MIAPATPPPERKHWLMPLAFAAWIVGSFVGMAVERMVRR